LKIEKDSKDIVKKNQIPIFEGYTPVFSSGPYSKQGENNWFIDTGTIPASSRFESLELAHDYSGDEASNEESVDEDGNGTPGDYWSDEEYSEGGDENIEETEEDNGTGEETSEEESDVESEQGDDDESDWPTITDLDSDNDGKKRKTKESDSEVFEGSSAIEAFANSTQFNKINKNTGSDSEHFTGSSDLEELAASSQLDKLMHQAANAKEFSLPAPPHLLYLQDPDGLYQASPSRQ
jgi:hypothetical protein